MKLSTILDPRFPMSLSERMSRLGEWTHMTVAWALPRRIIYWSVVRAAVVAAGDHRSPADVSSVDMLKGMETHAPHQR